MASGERGGVKLPADAVKRLEESEAGGRFGLFTSDLSVGEFLLLRKAGFLVLGTCVYHVAHRGAAQTVANLVENTELTKYSEALYDARELAMQRMQTEAADLGADGVVGVHLTEQSHFWGSHVIEFLAVGTAVRPLPDAPPAPDPQMVLSLDR